MKIKEQNKYKTKYKLREISSRLSLLIFLMGIESLNKKVFKLH